MQFRKWIRPNFIRYFGRRFNKTQFNDFLDTSKGFESFMNYLKNDSVVLAEISANRRDVQKLADIFNKKTKKAQYKPNIVKDNKAIESWVDGLKKRGII